MLPAAPTTTPDTPAVVAGGELLGLPPPSSGDEHASVQPNAPTSKCNLDLRCVITPLHLAARAFDHINVRRTST
jgi:hypothetical protein